MAIYPVQVSNLNNNYKNQISFQSRAGKFKTGILAGLLALSPFYAKGQYVHHGEKVLARDTVELFKGQKAEALLIDNDGNPNNFEKFAISTLRQFQFKSKHPKLNGSEGYMKTWRTQYVDTLLRESVRDDVKQQNYYRYYIVGPQIRRDALHNADSDIVTYFIDSEYKGKEPIAGVYEMKNQKMEIPEELYNELAKFLKNAPRKEEQVVITKKVENSGVFDVFDIYSW